MDYPKSVPNAGLVGGKFVDEDAGSGTPGSLIPSDWGNAITDEVLAVIAAAGLTPDENDNTQMAAALRLMLQQAAGNYALDTGTANTYLAAYTPAVSAPVDGMVLKFKAKTANTGASTFSPNGLLAKPIVGATHAVLQGGEIVANGDVWLQYNSSIGTGSWVLIKSTGGATGRLINIQVITASGTVTKTPGANKWRVRQIGGGGQGGGTQATGSSQVAAAGGGSSGSYAEALFDVSAISTATATIGTGGSTGANGANGANGGTTTLTMGTSSLTTPGGPGGGVGSATSSLPNEGGVAAALASAPSHVGALTFIGYQGGGATTGTLFSLAAAQPGIGGSCVFGNSRSSSAAGNASGYGAGGAGARSLISTGANNGPQGTSGVIIIEEYA